MNRRMTLGPVVDNQQNIATPSHGSKQSRLSMGLNKSRMSIALRHQPNQSANHVGGLSQEMNGMSLNAPSTGRPSMGVRRSSQQQSRRSSAFGGGRPSATPLYGGTASAMTRDPRQLRDKQVQLMAIKDLVRFLTDSGFEKPISVKLLTSPSAKDFQHIFTFLYNRLDPSYELKDRKFEEEVPILLRGLKYPFADQITKSQLYAVGTMHAWPNLLGMLHWMLELIVCCDRIESIMETDAAAQSDPKRLFFDATLQEYELFMQGKDDIRDLNKVVEEIFQLKDEWSSKEVERMQQELDLSKEELHRLKSTPSPLSQAQSQKQAYLGDIQKVKKWSETLSLKTTQLTEQIVSLKEIAEQKSKEVESLQSERNELQEIVDRQPISPADIDRMTSERDQHAKSIEQLTIRESTIKNRIWELEIACQKKLDKVEKAIKEFNDRAFRLDLIPASAKHADGLNFDISLNHHATRAEQMITVDLKGTIKQALMNLHGRFKSKALKTDDTLIALKETLDKMTESVAEKKDEVETLESKYKFLVEQYESEKETAAAEVKAKMEEIATIERELRRYKVEGTRDLFDSQKSLRELTIEYDNLVRRTGEQKERLVKETLKVVEELYEFKTRVFTQTQELQKQLGAQLHEQLQLNGEEKSEVFVSAMDRDMEVESEVVKVNESSANKDILGAMVSEQN